MPLSILVSRKCVDDMVQDREEAIKYEKTQAKHGRRPEHLLVGSPRRAGKLFKSRETWGPFLVQR